MNIIKKSMNTTIFKPNNNDDSIITLSSKDKKKLEFLAREQMKLDKLNQKKDSKVRKGGKIDEPNNLSESVFMNNIDSTPVIKPNSVNEPESDSESDSDSDDESNNKNKNKNKSKFDTANDSDSDSDSDSEDESNNKNKSKFDTANDSDSDDEPNVKTNNKNNKFDPDDDESDSSDNEDKDKDTSCNLPTANQVDKKTNKYSLSDSDFDSDSDDESNSKFKSKSKSNCKSNCKSNMNKDTVSKKRNLIKTVNHTKTQKALKNEQKLKNDLVEITNNITNNVTNNVTIDTNVQIDNDFEVNIKLQARSARKKICIITGIPNRFFADKEKNKDFIATMRATCATSVTLKEEKLDTDENISEYIIIIAGNKVDNVKSIICKFCNCPESNLKIHNLK